jgi:hypothetical protein
VQRYFDYYLDTRVIYQYYCQNFPFPLEAQYPLWLGFALGLNEGDEPGGFEVTSRAQQCFGYGLPDAQRTSQQIQIRDNLLHVLRMPSEDSLPGHLFLPGGAALADLNQALLGGINAIPNDSVQYSGSSDDKALNQGVARYAADPAAYVWLLMDGDVTGDIHVPVITMHTISDDLVQVENDAAYHDLVAQHHDDGFLAQFFVDDSQPGGSGHMAYTPSETNTGVTALLKWLDTGTPPAQADVAAICSQDLAQTGSAGNNGNPNNCRFSPGYTPKSLDGRVYPRQFPGMLTGPPGQ